MELEFARPAYLFLAGLLPLVWVFARRPPRVLRTDRLALWLRAAAGRRRRLPRPRALLETAFASLLVLAAAGLRRPARPGFREAWCLVDLSPSMAAPADFAEPARGSRLARARARIAALRARLPAGLRLRLFGLDGARIRPLAELPARPGRNPADPAPLPAFAAKGGERACVLFFSDGAGPTPWPARAPNLFFRAAAKVPDAGARRDGAILEASLEDPWPEARLSLRLVVRPPSSRAPLRLRFTPDGGRAELLAPRRREAAGGRVRLEFELPRRPGLLERLPADAFPGDDRLRFAPRPAWRPRIRVAPSLEGAAGLLAAFLAESLGAPAPRAGAGPAEVEILDGGAFARAPERGPLRLAFGTRWPGARAAGPLDRFPTWPRSEELLRGLDLGALEAPSCLVVDEAPPGARVLARFGSGVLAFFDPGRRVLWFGVRLADSNLARLPFLPVLALRVLGRTAPGGPRSQLAGLFPPRELELAPRDPGPERAPRWYRPPRSYERPLLAAALALFVLFLVLRRPARLAGPALEP